MAEVIELPIDQIKVDRELQFRGRLDKRLVDEYRADIERGDQFPPVDVMRVNGDIVLLDGFHRLEAYAKAGKTTIPARVDEGNYDTAWDHALLMNKKHGARLKQEESLGYVIGALKRLARMSDEEFDRLFGPESETEGGRKRGDKAGWTNADLARMTGLSPQTIMRHRDSGKIIIPAGMVNVWKRESGVARQTGANKRLTAKQRKEEAERLAAEKEERERPRPAIRADGTPTVGHFTETGLFIDNEDGSIVYDPDEWQSLQPAEGDGEGEPERIRMPERERVAVLAAEPAFTVPAMPDSADETSAPAFGRVLNDFFGAVDVWELRMETLMEQHLRAPIVTGETAKGFGQRLLTFGDRMRSFGETLISTGQS